MGDRMETGAMSGAATARQVRQERTHDPLVQRADAHALSGSPQTEMHGVADAPRANLPAVADLVQRSGEVLEI